MAQPSNHMTGKTGTQKLSIWFFTDNKPGHRNQLRGLNERLKALTDVEDKWIDITQEPFEWRNLIRRDYPGNDIPKPDMVIGAGHKTHRYLLTARRSFDAFCVVLMKPSLPCNWFDAVICPQHDQAPVLPYILHTTGVLNTITPASAPESDHGSSQKSIERQEGTMLIGGPSKHFGWSDEALIEQIKSVCQKTPRQRWQLSNSRRTPAEFIPALENLALANLKILHHEETTQSWLKDALENSPMLWVTPDSVSMVYEALTSGNPTCLFDLPPGSRLTRVARGVLQLVEKNMLCRYADWNPDAPSSSRSPDIWEADRAARWLLERYYQSRDMRSST